jgi:5-methylcytosine-specific restriction endonuclease McrA
VSFSKDTVSRAFKRQGGRCAYCGKKLSNYPYSGSGSWEAHHRISVSHGGSDSLGNCVILCIRGYNCHLNIGHSGQWKNHVPRHEDDFKYFRDGDEEAIY